jgi:hypothetical protein
MLDSIAMAEILGGAITARVEIVYNNVAVPLQKTRIYALDALYHGDDPALKIIEGPYISLP